MHLSSGCFDHSISRSLRKKGFGRDHFDNGPQEALRCLFFLRIPCTLRIRRTRKKVPTEWVDTNLFDGALFAQQCADPSAHQREECGRGCDRHASKQRALLCRDASIALIRTMCRIIGIGSVGRLFWLNGDIDGAKKYLNLFCKKSDTARQYVERWLPIVAASQSVKGKPQEREFLLSWVDVAEYQ